MDVFEFRDGLVADYADYVKSFIRIRDERIRNGVEESPRRGSLWPEPLLQLNPSFAPGAVLDDLVTAGTLNEQCGRVFRAGKTDEDPIGSPMRLHRHQVEAIDVARGGHDYVVTTGTGSGKSLTYFIPIVDQARRAGSYQILDVQHHRSKDVERMTSDTEAGHRALGDGLHDQLTGRLTGGAGPDQRALSQHADAIGEATHFLQAV